jgi:hypothetical protein
MTDDELLVFPEQEKHVHQKLVMQSLPVWFNVGVSQGWRCPAHNARCVHVPVQRSATYSKEMVYMSITALLCC